MYCSGCGHPLVPGQPFCTQCGRPAAQAVPPVPGMQFQLENYAGKIRALSIAWFVYAGLSMILGFASLAFARAFFAHHLGDWGSRGWSYGPNPQWLGPTFLHFIWIFVVMRSGLALAAGWALMERSRWGRVLAIVAAFFCILKFPFGMALGIWTLVMLLGYRNTTLYEQLP